MIMIIKKNECTTNKTLNPIRKETSNYFPQINLSYNSDCTHLLVNHNSIQLSVDVRLQKNHCCHHHHHRRCCCPSYRNLNFATMPTIWFWCFGLESVESLRCGLSLALRLYCGVVSDNNSVDNWMPSDSLALRRWQNKSVRTMNGLLIY